MDREISRRVFLERATALGVLMEAVSVGAGAQPPRAVDRAGLRDSAALPTLAAIAAQIIPTDETPGAREANVVDYLQEQIAGSQELQKLCVTGLREVDALSRQRFGAPFAHLDANHEVDILKAVETSDFFKVIRDLTVKGFYNSREGWRSTGFPGHQPHGHRDFDQPPAVRARES